MKKAEQTTNPQKDYTKRIVTVGLFSAIAVVLVFLLRLPIIPSLSFLEYDMADVPIILITFMYGPIAGLLTTLTVSIIQGVTVSAGSGWIGIVMHILATGGYVLVAGNIYKRRPTLGGEILSLGAGAGTMVATMILWNILFTPLYMGVPREALFELLPLIILFNVIKAGANSLIAYLLFKVLQQILKHTGLSL